MNDQCDTCPREPVYAVQFQTLNASLGEVKDRVTRLETTLARGVLLLVANLVGMVVTLAREFLAV